MSYQSTHAVTLNLFQGLSRLIGEASLSQWILNQVQHDEILEGAVNA